MNYLPLLIGIALTLAGRHLFWLFVGGVGFLYGIEMAPRLFPEQTELAVWLIALLLGVVGAALAILLQKLAVGLAGALIGGYLLAEAVRAVGWEPGNLELVLFLIGAIVGAVVTIVLFDWALIILSSLAGAALVIQPLDLSRAAEGWIFLAVAAIGILLQATVFLRSRTAIAPARPSE